MIPCMSRNHEDLRTGNVNTDIISPSGNDMVGQTLKSARSAGGLSSRAMFSLGHLYISVFRLTMKEQHGKG